MANYWIRNRGRVQGPFTAEQIQGLQRRGRFSRMFHVSEDNKSWHPAEDFPELFERARKSRSSRQDDDDFEDTPFNSGGSPFDDDEDDYAPPKKRSASGKAKSRPQARPVEADDDDDDDEDWEDDDAGLLTGVIEWVEANVKLLAGILVCVLLGLGWFVFFREDWTQDTADFEQLLSLNSEVVSAHQNGTASAEWGQMLEKAEGDLAAMVTRLTKTASTQDHVKQELLFIARDDIPLMFKELPAGVDFAKQRVQRRLSLIDEMIQKKERYTAESVLPIMPKTPASSPARATGNAGGQPQSPDAASETGNAGGQPPAGVDSGNSSQTPIKSFQPGGSQPKDDDDDNM